MITNRSDNKSPYLRNQTFQKSMHRAHPSRQSHNKLNSNVSPDKMTFGNWSNQQSRYSQKNRKLSYDALAPYNKQKQKSIDRNQSYKNYDYQLRSPNPDYIQGITTIQHNDVAIKQHLTRSKSNLPLMPNKSTVSNQRNFNKYSLVNTRNRKMIEFTCYQLQQLLKNQQDVIKSVKQICLNDEQRIQRDFTDFQQNLINLVDDIKLSAISIVKQQYSRFVMQFKQLKSQFISYSRVKKQFWQQKQLEQFNLQEVKFPHKQFISNQKLLGNLNQDLKMCQKHVYYEQFKRIQTKILKPILKKSEIIYSQYQHQSYYSPEDCYKVLQDLLNQIKPNFHKLYSQINQFIIKHQKNQSKVGNKNEKQLSNNYTFPQKNVRQISQISHFQPQNSCLSQLSKLQIKNSTLNSNITQKQNKQLKNKQKNASNSALLQLESYKSNCNYQGCVEIDRKHKFVKKLTNQKIHPNKNEVDHAQQIQTVPCSFYNVDDIKKDPYGQTYSSTISSNNGWNPSNLGHDHKNKSRSSKFIDNPKNNRKNPQNASNIQHQTHGQQIKQQETALCIVYLNNWNQIAVGTKNGYLKIFCAKTLQKIAKQKIYETSICSMAYIDQKYIALGSDFSSSQIVLWNQHSPTNKIAAKLKYHKAAVTSILDLEDGSHFFSTGFDSQMIIYSHKAKTKKISVCTNQKISMSAFNKNKQKVVICLLNKSLQIWQISRAANSKYNQITNLELVNSIQLLGIPTCISSYSAKHTNCVVIGFTGKLKQVSLIDIDQCNILQSYELDEGIQDILALQSKKQKSNNYQLHQNSEEMQKNKLFLCLKNGQIIQFDTKRGIKQVVGNGCSITYTHGIGRKSILTIDGKLFACNHANHKETQIDSWQVL